MIRSRDLSVSVPDNASRIIPFCYYKYGYFTLKVEKSYQSFRRGYQLLKQTTKEFDGICMRHISAFCAQMRLSSI